MKCPHSVVELPEKENLRRSTQECTLCFAKEDLNGCLTCGNAFCRVHVSLHVDLFPQHLLFAVLSTNLSLQNGSADHHETPPIYCAECECEVTQVVDSETHEKAYKWNLVDPKLSEGRDEHNSEFSSLECPHRSVGSDGIQYSPSSLCRDCEKSEPLWICLTCGFTACGREELGGGGHASRHASNTGHPLSVRYESLTAANQEEVWCYQCNEFTRCENIRERMEEMGVIYQTPTKKFKTINEMEQDYNAAILPSLSPTTCIAPTPPRGQNGILNVGNSCYMGSALQLLLPSEGVMSVFGGTNVLERHMKNTRDHPLESLCKICQFIKITTGLSTASIDRYISPSFFKSSWCDDSIFETSDQQDVDEFLCFLLEKISELEKSISLIPAGHCRQHYEICVVNTSQCVECQYTTFRKEWQWTLHLCLPQYVFDPELSEESFTTQKIDIEECFNATFETKIESLHCSKCDKKRDFEQKKAIVQFPQCLFVYIQKYYWDAQAFCIRKARVEINCDSLKDDPITIFDRLRIENILSPEELSHFQNEKAQSIQTAEDKHHSGMEKLTTAGYSDQQSQDSLLRFGGDALKALEFLDSQQHDIFSQASDAICPGSEIVLYKQHGYVIHYGAHANSGHYVAYRKSDGIWFEFNDETVTSQESCEMEKACLYAFMRCVD